VPENNELPRNICPKCRQEMRIANQDDKSTLYKCPNPGCGHMVLIQDIERNKVRSDGKS